MFFKLKKKYSINKDKLKMTKKLTITIALIDFITIFTEQIQLEKRNQKQRDQLKQSIEQIEYMINRLDY